MSDIAFLVCVTLALFCLVFLVLHFDLIGRWVDWLEYRKKPRCEWHCVAYGGGAAVWIGPMTREEAIAYCSDNLGLVSYVDDDRQHIFYKPPGWTGSAYPGQLGM